MSRGSVHSPGPCAANLAVLALVPIIAVAFLAYLVIGLALPVLPLHVHKALGLSILGVGLVAGSQFAASLVSRVFAGHHIDSRGPQRAVVTGLLIAAAGRVILSPIAAVRIQAEDVGQNSAAARALHGIAESFIITGALSSGLALVGPRNTGIARRLLACNS
jgi:MFS family permease